MCRHSGPQVGEVGGPFEAQLCPCYLQVVQEVLARALPSREKKTNTWFVACWPPAAAATSPASETRQSPTTFGPHHLSCLSRVP